ncbi:MAG TPA: Ig-like domain-containing protein [Gemmatimonadales bacterium]|nr:Ig-like domain-containing protein [Gemmatimonadales bacterium]
MRRTTALGWTAMLIALGACGGGDNLLLPGSGAPATVTIVQGDGQNGRVGQALPQPLVAEVLDASGRPIEGATVVFALTDPAPDASIAPDTATTNADGQASANVVLGTRPGSQAGQVRALGGSPSATVNFTLNALPENANGIAAVSGQDQTAPVGSMLPAPLVVQVTDPFGNPIADVTVAWTVDGGGAVSAASTTTGSDGTTSVQRTLGATAGAQHTFATVDGLVGSPVTFTATATAGAASGVTIVSGDGQTGPVSTELPNDLVVEVRDAGGNAVPSVAVAWVVGTGGGSVTPTTSVTDANGRASAAWTLGPSPGSNTLSAVVSGIGVVQFSATATAGAAARLRIQTQPSATAVSGVPLAQQPVIQLLDAQGNESKQSGVTVQVAIAAGGGTLAGTTSVQTDADGRAAFSGLTLSGSAGNRTLRFSATGFASVTSQAISLGAAPTTTTITSDSPDPSTTGQDVTVQFTVASPAGTPTGSVTVQDDGDSCSGTLSGGQGSCVIKLSNTGNRTLTASYGGTEGFAASSTTVPHTVTAPAQPVLAITTQPASSATAGQALSQQPVIQLRGGDGSDLATAGVAVSAAIATGGGTLSGTTTVNTDAQGRATFTDLVISGDPGTRTLVFTAPGYQSATSGNIDVQAAPPPPPSASQSSVTVAPDTVLVGATSTITVTVRDASGTALAGVSVTADATGSGNTITGSPGTTGADGVVTFTISSTTAEAKTITATAESVALGTPQTLTVEAPPPASGLRGS